MSQLLFLDTNVFLSFFHFSADDLEALRQLTVLVKREKVRLLLPDQVVREFRRNRDGNVAEAIKQLETAKLPTQYPRLCQDFEEYKELRAKLDDYEKARKSLLVKVNDAARKWAFRADSATEELFKVATALEMNPEIFTRADIRYRRGDPPGKRDQDSLGDAIIWETLLASDSQGDLFFVAEDADWASALDRTAFNVFIHTEWANAKKGNVHFYQRLSGFLVQHYPDIKLSTELEKDKLIEALASATSFAQTHAAIAALREVADFTKTQLNAIVSAYVVNDQIYRIIDDPDVRDFLMDNLIDRVGELDEQVVPTLLDVIDERAANDSPLRYLRMEIGMAWYGPGEVVDSRQPR